MSRIEGRILTVDLSGDIFIRRDDLRLMLTQVRAMLLAEPDVELDAPTLLDIIDRQLASCAATHRSRVKVTTK